MRFLAGPALAAPLALALLTATARAQKPSAALSALGSVADHLLVCNATAARVRYETRRPGEEKGTANELPPGDYHLFSSGKGLVCHHGEPAQETALVGGSLYQFRSGPEGKRIVLVRLVIRQPDEATERENLKAKVRGLQEELDRSRVRKDKAHVVLPAPASERLVRELGRSDRPDAGKETVTILSYPPGPAYLVDLSGRRRWTRTYLGRAPLVCRLPPGAYQVLLEQPATGPGSWAAPAGRSKALGFGARTARCLEVNLVKEAGAAALVRALWLTPGGSMTDRLERATREAGELFADLPADDFRRFCTAALARARVAVTRQEGDRLAAALRRLGWLRYEVAGGAVDFEHAPGAAEPFRVKVVRSGQ
jgi:hypothetical protein